MYNKINLIHKRRFINNKQLSRRLATALMTALIVGTGGYFAAANALTTAPQSAQPAAGTVKRQPNLSNSSLVTNAVSSPVDSVVAKPASKKANTDIPPVVNTAPPAPTSALSTIAKGSGLYVAPSQAATYERAAAAAGTASDAAVLTRLASQPTAQWFGDWNSDVRLAVNNYVSAARSDGRVPVLVAYNIPYRDCGGESAGGVSSFSNYATWIRQFAAGVGSRPAIVILEPDAVAASCFSDARAAAISDALHVLQSAGASVYVDGGNSNWMSASIIAERLQRSGVAAASGFSLNVSNFQTTGSSVTYGSAVSKLIGGKHFVIDTSRNGNGPLGSEWCNPTGRALGAAPTTQTGYSLVDALLWVKVPGESDGNCGPAIGSSQPPAAGQFWPAYALMLARNAGW